MSTPGQGSILGSSIIYAKVDSGPTFGQIYRPVNQKRVVTAAGTDTIRPFDQTVIYAKSVPTTFNVQLPDLNNWMNQAYGLFDLALIDGAQNAGTFPITILPFGSQKIDGAGSAQITADGGSMILVPLLDRTGWDILLSSGSGGGSNMSVPKGYQQISSLAVATALTVPVGATSALIVPDGAAVRWRDDGTNPTASVGMLLGIGEELTYTASGIDVIKFIEQTAGAILNITYYG